MKKRLFIFIGVLCSFGYYSCTKDMIRDSAKAESSQLSARQSKPASGSDIFDPTGLVSPSSHGKLETLGTGFSFTEGPAVDKKGNIFFTDQPNDKIYRWDVVNGKITTFLTGTGRSNGMAFDKAGYLIACADLHGELWKIAPDGSHTVLVNNYNGKLLNGPNDVWINPVTGGMYISDPMFPRGYWDDTDPRKIGNPGWPPVFSEQGAGIAGHVYYLAPGSHTLVRVTTMAGWDAANIWPNGVVGSPDGKKLYVNHWTGDATGHIWAFDINADGTLSNMTTLVSGLSGCDGMSMDDQGNIYVSAGGGVSAFDPNGNRVFTINTGGATNNVFGGHNNKTLFITGPVDKLSSLKMNVKGVEKY